MRENTEIKFYSLRVGKEEEKKNEINTRHVNYHDIETKII